MRRAVHPEGHGAAGGAGRACRLVLGRQCASRSGIASRRYARSDAGLPGRRARAPLTSGPGILRDRGDSMRDESRPPSLATDDATGHLRLAGSWTLVHAAQMGEALRGAPEGVSAVDADDVDRLDSSGVLLLLRFASPPRARARTLLLPRGPPRPRRSHRGRRRRPPEEEARVRCHRRAGPPGLSRSTTTTARSSR
jgi:ABC-type transporter Mla MlaB component